MSRTRKDIMVVGYSVEQVRAAVQKWFGENNIKVVESSENSIKGRWGTGFLTAPKYFQVSLTPKEGGAIAHTEGWIAVYWISEQEFKTSAMNVGGIPRKEGWRVIERLWSMLESLSKDP